MIFMKIKKWIIGWHFCNAFSTNVDCKYQDFEYLSKKEYRKILKNKDI